MNMSQIEDTQRVHFYCYWTRAFIHLECFHRHFFCITLQMTKWQQARHQSHRQRLAAGAKFLATSPQVVRSNFNHRFTVFKLTV